MERRKYRDENFSIQKNHPYERVSHDSTDAVKVNRGGIFIKLINTVS